MDTFAGPLRRFFAYAVDSFVAIFLLYLLSQWIQGPRIAMELHQYLEQFSGLSVAHQYFKFFLFFFIVTQGRNLFTLILGVSLGQWLMGIYSTGGWLWMRIGGSVRVQLEFILLPIFVFADFPCLFAKRGVKEILSITALRSANNIRFFISFFFALPFSLLLAIISPGIYDGYFFQKMPIRDIQLVPEDLSAKSDFSQFTTYRSSTFHFLTLSSLSSRRYLLIPSFVVEKDNGVLKRIAQASFYDLKSKKTILMQKTADVKWHEILQTAKNNNPLFFARYPELSVALAKDPTLFARREYRPEYGTKIILSQDIVSQMRTLVDTSLHLNFSQIFDHLLSNGPFISGFVDLRQAILDVLDKEKITMIENTNLGDQRFLIFSGSGGRLEGPSTTARLVLWGIDSFNPALISLSSADASIEELKQFQVEFFSSANWFFDYNHILKAPLKESDLDPFSALDLLGRSDFTPETRKIVEDYLYHHLFDLCRQAVLDQDQKLSQLLTQALNRQILVAQDLWDRKLIGRDYISFIRALKVSLINKDKKYFAL